MILEIKKEDIDTAIQATKNSPAALCKACVLFQAAKRSGLDVRGVWLHTIGLNDGRRLRPKKKDASNFQRFTFCDPDDYSRLKPCTLELEAA